MVFIGPDFHNTAKTCMKREYDMVAKNEKKKKSVGLQLHELANALYAHKRPNAWRLSGY